VSRNECVGILLPLKTYLERCMVQEPLCARLLRQCPKICFGKKNGWLVSSAIDAEGIWYPMVWYGMVWYVMVWKDKTNSSRVSAHLGPSKRTIAATARSFSILLSPKKQWVSHFQACRYWVNDERDGLPCSKRYHVCSRTAPILELHNVSSICIQEVRSQP
jgi:hypothetical protein